MIYNVTRQHLGDKLYLKGDQREADPHSVAHLVSSGVLVAVKEPVEEKALNVPKNKARKVSRNKAE